MDLQNVESADEKLDQVLKYNQPILCDVIIDPAQRVIPKLEFGKPIDDLSPLLSRKEYLSNKF